MRTVEVVEAIFDGSPRWAETAPSYRQHTRLAPSSLNRQRRVVERMEEAWADTRRGKTARKQMKAFAKGNHVLLTCTNPTCKHRRQLHAKVHSYNKVDHSRMVNCKGCGKPQAQLVYRPIETKYLYVLTGKGAAVKLAFEVYIESEGNWHMLPAPGIKPRSQRQLDEKNKRVVKGTSKFKVKSKVPYQFFLSPVQLGKAALQKLVATAKEDPPALKDQKLPRGWMVDQLAGGTLRRTFSGLALNGYTERAIKAETVCVADPFAFSEEADEFDFRPILAAYFELMRNSSELAKLQIASILDSLIGKPPKPGDKVPDKFDLIDEMGKTAKRLKNQHSAAAWLTAHRKCLEHLAREVEHACRRLIEWLDSPGHRVVEIACQEEGPKLSYLALGILHYNRVLRDIMGSPAGEAFIARTHAGKAGDTASRIPYKNILHPKKRARMALARIRKDYGDIGANLLAIYAPPVIRGAKLNQEAKEFLKHLARVGLPKSKMKLTGKVDSSRPLGYQDFRIMGAFLALNEKRIEITGKSYLPARLSGTFYDRLKLFSNWENRVAGLCSLWTGLKVYSEKPKPYEGQRDRFVRKKAQVEYPFKVIGFALEQSKAAMAWRVQKLYGIDVGKWVDATKAGRTVVVSSESLMKMNQYGLSRFSRLTNAYRVVGKVSDIFAGPVAFVFGGIDLVIQTQGAFGKWQDGDYAAGVGNALIATAAVITVSTSIVTSLALFNVSWAVGLSASLGPFAVAAVVLVLLGAIIIAAFAKNDLELYASHCFLGKEYGKGAGLFKSSGQIWAEGTEFPSWAKSSDPARFMKQARYLVNLVGNFTVWVGNGPYEYTKYGARVHPGYLPQGAVAEVVVIANYEKKDAKGAWVPCTCKSTALINMDTGGYFAWGDELEDHSVVADPSGTWGTRKFACMEVKLKPKLKAGMRRPKRTAYGGTVHSIDSWKVKVRLDINGTGHFLPVGKNKYVELDWPKDAKGLYCKKDSLGNTG